MTRSEIDRARRHLERTFAGLVKKGWRIEEYHSSEVLEEPYRVTVTLSIEDIGVMPEKGVL